HGIGHFICRPLLAQRLDEDQPRGLIDPTDACPNILIFMPAFIFERSADDSPRVHHVVGGIDDATAQQIGADRIRRELVVGRTYHEWCMNLRHVLGSEHGAKRTGRNDVDGLEQDALGRSYSRTKFGYGASHIVRVDVRNHERRTGAVQELAEVVANLANTLDGHAESLEVATVELELDCSAHGEVDTECSLRRRIAASACAALLASADVTRMPGEDLDIGFRDADVLGRDVSTAETSDGATKCVQQAFGLADLRVSDDDRLATAKRQPSERILEAHAARKSQHIFECLLLCGVWPYAASAKSRT